MLSRLLSACARCSERDQIKRLVTEMYQELWPGSSFERISPRLSPDEVTFNCLSSLVTQRISTKDFKPQLQTHGGAVVQKRSNLFPDRMLWVLCQKVRSVCRGEGLLEPKRVPLRCGKLGNGKLVPVDVCLRGVSRHFAEQVLQSLPIIFLERMSL